ncbi:Cirl [Strongyloides ratti]|uniref:Cirl n=1 Tax=Strongyloides ratti TaxID=34506 RepID=A0A090LP58_STRRB|nr:Cirl [Strongyloides ratti]CEF71551.1 Cirl [Strongyloides ratti]
MNQLHGYNLTEIATKYCSSNGIPIFVPSKYLYNFYNQNDYFYNGKCYTILPGTEKYNWETSLNICNDIGFDLLEITTDDEVNAIQTIILSNFETYEIYNSDFWIGANAIWLNTSGLQWIWNKKTLLNDRQLTNFYWENNKEEQFMNYNDKCIKITRNSWYKQWKATSCLEDNRIICEKDINNEIEKEYYYIQCECNNEFSGLFCNKTNTDLYTSNKFICSQDRLFFSCPINTLIHVNFAQFGIFDKGISLCNNSVKEKNATFNCTDPFSLQTLKSTCQGKQFCDIEKVNSIFDYSICSKNSFSGLKYRMECLNKNEFNKCPPDFDLVDNKCIKLLLEDKKNWYESRKICNYFNGDLINSITTPEIEKYIKNKISNITNDNIYFWHLGYLSDYEKNNNSCPMVVFNINSNNEQNINILDCNEKINFICQKSSSILLDDYLQIDKTIKNTLNQQTKSSYLQSSSLSLRCPSVTWYSLVFEESDMCTNATAICSDDGQLAYLQCGCSTNEWIGLPNTKMCVHSFYNDIDKQILLNGDINSLSNYLYNNLSNYIKDGELYSGDLVKSIDTIKKLIDYSHKKLYNNIDNITDDKIFIENIAKSGDKLLSEDNRENWNFLNENDGIKKNISLLMNLLEELIHNSWKKKEFSMNESQLTNWEFLFIPNYNDNFVTTSYSHSLLPSVIEKTFPYVMLPSMNDIEESSLFKRKRRNFEITKKELSVAYYVYKNMYWLLKPNSTKMLNSYVIGTTINSPNNNIYFKNNSTVKIILNHMRKKNIDNVTCVYWDKKNFIWSTYGCYVDYTNIDYTVCACNHLTNFAILIDVRGDELITLNNGTSDALELISIFGCALSVLFLFVSILIFQFLPSIHSERVYIHRNLCITLLASELTFIIGIHRTFPENGCKIVAIILHYLFLSSFCWMLVEGCELYRLLIKVFEPDESYMNYYYTFSILFPGIIVAFSGGFGWKNYGTYDYCWINAKSGLIWTFVGPIIGIIIINICVLFIALKVVLSIRSRDRKTGNKIMGWLKGSSTLLCLLGITWVFGFLSAIKKIEPIFTFIFTILNSLQGVFIFIFHILLNEKIQKALIKNSIRLSSIFRKSKVSQFNNGTTSNNTSITNNNEISSKNTSSSLWKKIKISLSKDSDEDDEGTIHSINQIP